MTIAPGQGWPIVIVGLMLFAQIGTFHWGLNYTSSGHGSVMIGSNPLWVALLAHFLLRGDRLTMKKAYGLGVAVLGVVTVVASQHTPGAAAHDTPTFSGDAVVLFSSWLLGAKTVYTKHTLVSIEPAKLLFWSNLLASCLLLATGWVWEGWERFTFNWPSFYGLLYQGLVVAGFCFAAWTALLRRHRASQLAVFGFAQPLFGILFGAWLRHDTITPGVIGGGLAVATGILLVTREGAAAQSLNKDEPELEEAAEQTPG